MTTEPKNSVDELVEVDDTDPLERAEIADDPEERRLEAQTDEGAQKLKPLAGESRTQELVLTGGPWPDVDDTMILNMGPQHPSTHGVLRIMMELDGETVLRAKPVIGYLHTGMEKTGEELTYVQGATNVTRMDYASPLFNELPLQVFPCSPRVRFVTVSTCTGTDSVARAMAQRTRGAIENMEGAAIVHVARLHGIDVGEIRGVSNIVTNRDKAAWQLQEAAAAAQEILADWVSGR